MCFSKEQELTIVIATDESGYANHVLKAPIEEVKDIPQVVVIDKDLPTTASAAARVPAESTVATEQEADSTASSFSGKHPTLGSNGSVISTTTSERLAQNLNQQLSVRSATNNVDLASTTAIAPSLSKASSTTSVSASGSGSSGSASSSLKSIDGGSGSVPPAIRKLSTDHSAPVVRTSSPAVIQQQQFSRGSDTARPSTTTQEGEISGNWFARLWRSITRFFKNLFGRS